MTQTLSTSVNIPASTDIIEQVSEPLPDIEPSFTDNALTVMEIRYLKRDEHGTVIERPEDMFRRVAKVVAGAEDLFGNTDIPEQVEQLFYNMMVTGEFLPNSPTLMNAGRDLGQLSACFVLPVDDSMDSIFQSLRDAALIHKSGGGTGFSFSRLRPKNDMVKSTRGISSGPVSFMSVYDAATETIKQGGTRRGANMGILRVDHTDIREFVSCKRDGVSFSNFNISVAITDDFMEAVRDGSLYNLTNPHSGELTRRENAREVFELMVENAHASGDPGIVFIDRMNEANPLPHLGDFESTNPCGEQPLLPYESCNLGSINLARMIAATETSPSIDWGKLGRTVRLAVRFLDNVIEVNRYPLPAIAEITKKTRKIGLGIMGFADLLIELGIPYDSAEAVDLAGEIMSFIDTESKAESRHLAESRGAFPVFEGSSYDRAGEPPLRNATTTTIAPTGSISIIAGCSSGIEPLFAVAFTRRVLDGKTLTEIHPAFLRAMHVAGGGTDAVLDAAAGSRSIQHIEGIPDAVKHVFRTSSDVAVEWHIRIQAAFQRHTDNAVSKTVNFPREATIEDIAAAFQLAWDHRLKGITIYRDGSKDVQVLTTSAPGRAEIAASPRKPRPRPQVTRGTTEKIKTGCGNLYVTVNSDEKGLCEVFCQMGRSGGCTSSQSEAISRLISLALRSGVNLEEIVSELKGIRCPSPIWQNGRMILSCADAMATALAGHVNGHASAEVPVISPDADSEKLASLLEPEPVVQKGEMAGVCPDCGGVLISAEGCLVCRSCGYSKCG